MTKRQLSDIEQKALKFTQDELDAEGFNSKVWHIKEIPLPNEVITFCNDVDNVEFTTLIYEKGKVINFAWNKAFKDGSYENVDTDYITEAIERNEEK